MSDGKATDNAPTSARGRVCRIDKKLVGSYLRRARCSQGRTQADVAACAAIGQPELSRIEMGRQLPRLDTFLLLCNALALTSNERCHLFSVLGDGLDDISWSQRLQITSYQTAWEKARRALDRGDCRGAYGYLRAVFELAEDAEQSTRALFLWANHEKDTGDFARAEILYNQLLELIDQSGQGKFLPAVQVNLAETMFELGRYSMAELISEGLIARLIEPEAVAHLHELAHAYLVRGRAVSMNHESDALALTCMEKAIDLYDHMGLSSQHAWAELLHAEMLLRNGRRRKRARQTIADLAEAWGPVDGPEDPEVFAMAHVILGESTGDRHYTRIGLDVASRYRLGAVAERALRSLPSVAVPQRARDARAPVRRGLTAGLLACVLILGVAAGSQAKSCNYAGEWLASRNHHCSLARPTTASNGPTATSAVSWHPIKRSQTSRSTWTSRRPESSGPRSTDPFAGLAETDHPKRWP